LISLYAGHRNAACTCHELSDVLWHCDLMAAGGILDDDRISLAHDCSYDRIACGLLNMDTLFGIPSTIEDSRVCIVDKHPVWECEVPVLEEMPREVQFISRTHSVVQ
jgi:hypothetical protein